MNGEELVDLSEGVLGGLELLELGEQLVEFLPAEALLVQRQS